MRRVRRGGKTIIKIYYVKKIFSIKIHFYKAKR